MSNETDVPSSYRVQSACARCKHVERECQTDDAEHWFCAQDGTKRPEVHPGLWSQAFRAVTEDEKKALRDRLSAEIEAEMVWNNRHRVEPHGICDRYASPEFFARTVSDEELHIG